MAAAPAPLTTTRIVSIFFPLSSRAFSNPAAEIMAVPCWSSCITGISSSSLSRCSISKHSGALISSRSFVSSSMSNTSMSANILNNNPFPSMTGLPDKAPISPSPSTAVPFEITATKLLLAVYL